MPYSLTDIIINSDAWKYEHWQTVDWSELVNWKEYTWKQNVTPFSQFELPFITVIAYLLIVFFLWTIMRFRAPFDSRLMSWICSAHNLILTIWSLIMCLGTSFYAFYGAYEYGHISDLVCEHANDTLQGPLYFFGYWFYLSKYYELLDTVILCLRKRPLTLLHIYHHAIVILLTYLWVYSDYPLFWWTVWLNTTVHVFMYFYFFLISLGFRISTSWKRVLTSIQIGQFCVYGIVAATNCYLTIQNFAWSFTTSYEDNDPFNVIGSRNSFEFSYNHGCKGSLWILAASIVVNISILALFLNFFKQTYLKRLIRHSFDNPPTCKDKIE